MSDKDTTTAQICEKSTSLRYSFAMNQHRLLIVTEHIIADKNSLSYEFLANTESYAVI